jgi:hypothetical protein
MGIHSALGRVLGLPALALGLTCVACGGETGVRPGSDGGAGATGTMTGASMAAAPPPKTSFTAAEVQAALAQCDLPHGPAVVPETWGDFRALLVGAWLPCGDGDSGDPMQVLSQAIEFAADGTWFHLLSDGAGGLLRGQGVWNQGNYTFPTGYDADVHPDTDPVHDYPWVFVTALSHDETPDGTFEGVLTFESSPSRLYAVQQYNEDTFRTWLVAIR